MKKVFIISAVVIIGLILAWNFGWKKNSSPVQFSVTQIDRGDIVQTVNATGVVQPIKLVQVGSQINGTIKKLYADFNTQVQEDDIVAQIDPEIYQAQVDSDKSNLTRCQADVERIKTSLVLAEKELIRSQELAVNKLIAQSDFDTALANRDILKSQLKQAEATVKQSESALRMSEVRLGYTVIRSPVSGVVISRNVDEGQTIVASMSVQNIFEIATDLKKMQIEANIPEADIGRIKVGQSVVFTVDAYPDIEFSGQVSEVRLSPTTVSNVVTYTVIISADNPNEQLFPGMTANLTCRVKAAHQVLRVSNEALRYSPDAALIENQVVSATTGMPPNKPVFGQPPSGMPFPPAPGSGGPSAGNRMPTGLPPLPRGMPQMPPGFAGLPGKSEPNNSGIDSSGQNTQLWIRTNTGLLQAIAVKVGITDGSFTEIISGNISEGQEIVTGILEKGEIAPENMTNPFGPKPPPGAQKQNK